MTPFVGIPILLGLALIGFILWSSFSIAWDAAHPPRKGFAWALATGRPRSPESLEMIASEQTLPGLDGVNCPAWHIEGTGPLHAPTLLMLHGWGRSRWDSLSRLEPLLPCVREAWLPDLPAHGEHAAGNCWVGVREPIAVADMLAQIAAQRPGAPIVIMGHSLGAGVAIRGAIVALERNIPVVGVIALSPYRDLRSPIPGRLALRDLPSWPFTPLALRMLAWVGRMDEPLEHDAARLHCPALLVACEDDSISPADDATLIAQAMPHATLMVLPGDRHDEPGATDRTRFEASLQAFVRGVTPTRQVSETGLA